MFESSCCISVFVMSRVVCCVGLRLCHVGVVMAFVVFVLFVMVVLRARVRAMM